MKILIIRFSSIGDIVLTTPVIRAVKTQLAGVELHYCTKPAYFSILNNNPYLDKIHGLETDLNSLIKKLKKERFDFIIDLHNNLRTKLLKLALQVRSSSFNKINWQKWLMVRFKINKLPNTHVVNRYLDAAKSLGVHDDGLGLDYFIPEKDEVESDWLPTEFRQEYVALVVGAKFNTKRLPEDRLVELCDRINKPIVLLGGKGEFEIGERLEAFFKKNHGDKITEEQLETELNKKAIVFNGCGKFNLNQSAFLLNNSSVVFTHDTGLMHIAAAFQKTIFCIWGNTIPDFGMYPYKTKFIVLENNKISCRPCSKIGFHRCPKGHFKCMSELVFDFYIP